MEGLRPNQPAANSKIVREQARWQAHANAESLGWRSSSGGYAQMTSA